MVVLVSAGGSVVGSVLVVGGSFSVLWTALGGSEVVVSSSPPHGEGGGGEQAGEGSAHGSGRLRRPCGPGFSSPAAQRPPAPRAPSQVSP